MFGLTDQQFQFISEFIKGGQRKIEPDRLQAMYEAIRPEVAKALKIPSSTKAVVRLKESLTAQAKRVEASIGNDPDRAYVAFSDMSRTLLLLEDERGAAERASQLQAAATRRYEDLEDTLKQARRFYGVTTAFQADFATFTALDRKCQIALNGLDFQALDRGLAGLEQAAWRLIDRQSEFNAQDSALCEFASRIKKTMALVDPLLEKVTQLQSKKGNSIALEEIDALTRFSQGIKGPYKMALIPSGEAPDDWNTAVSDLNRIQSAIKSCEVKLAMHENAGKTEAVLADFRAFHRKELQNPTTIDGQRLRKDFEAQLRALSGALDKLDESGAQEAERRLNSLKDMAADVLAAEKIANEARLFAGNQITEIRRSQNNDPLMFSAVNGALQLLFADSDDPNGTAERLVQGQKLRFEEPKGEAYVKLVDEAENYETGLLAELQLEFDISPRMGESRERVTLIENALSEAAETDPPDPATCLELKKALLIALKEFQASSKEIEQKDAAEQEEKNRIRAAEEENRVRLETDIANFRDDLHGLDMLEAFAKPLYDECRDRLFEASDLLTAGHSDQCDDLLEVISMDIAALGELNTRITNDTDEKNEFDRDYAAAQKKAAKVQALPVATQEIKECRELLKAQMAEARYNGDWYLFTEGRDALNLALETADRALRSAEENPEADQDQKKFKEAAEEVWQELGKYRHFKPLSTYFSDLIARQREILVDLKEAEQGFDFASGMKIVETARALYPLLEYAALQYTEAAETAEKKALSATEALHEAVEKGTLAEIPTRKKIKLLSDMRATGLPLSDDQRKLQRAVFNAMDLDPAFQEAEKEKRASIVKAFKSADPFKTMPNEDIPEDWIVAKEADDKIRVLQKACDLQCGVLGIPAPKVCAIFKPGADCGAYDPMSRTIQINLHPTNGEQTFKSFINTVAHETTHHYQAILVERVKDGDIIFGDPEFIQASMFLVNSGPYSYVPPNEDGDSETYAKQPVEMHAFLNGNELEAAFFSK